MKNSCQVITGCFSNYFGLREKGLGGNNLITIYLGLNHDNMINKLNYEYN
jgi:hypothetical protein